ncbi:uncharacterized protein BKA78DRAFT_315766 [Phyllosticta capitalensis]|uniref:uncharacterized protein n=1 Tax=Phyllosticta capitalensis TaxID=121624 RepID=UPI00312D9A06
MQLWNKDADKQIVIPMVAKHRSTLTTPVNSARRHPNQTPLDSSLGAGESVDHASFLPLSPLSSPLQPQQPEPGLAYHPEYGSTTTTAAYSVQTDWGCRRRMHSFGILPMASSRSSLLGPGTKEPGKKQATRRPRTDAHVFASFLVMGIAPPRGASRKLHVRGGRVYDGWTPPCLLATLLVD